MEPTITVSQARAIELAIRDLGHNLEALCDAVYWLKPNAEDKAVIMDIKDATRDSLMTLHRELNQEHSS